MSLETWKAEFYPIAATECTVESAVEHSLRKWKGLRRYLLSEHGCKININGDVTDDGVQCLAIGSMSCALCHHYLSPIDSCRRCPLAIARGLVACDETMVGEKESPWQWWSNGQDPEPMIAWLEKCQ